MPYRFLEDIAKADVAFEAEAGSLTEVFKESAEALTNVMVEDPERVERKEAVTIEASEENLEMLLFSFLNELVYYKDARRLLLRVDSVDIKEGPGGCALSARAYGEPIDPSKHPLGADVKAVTLHLFSLKKTDKGWKATVVLDI